MLARVVFRVDAMPHMGVGHLSRCLALGHELKKHNFEIFFVCQEGVGTAKLLVEREGFTLICLPVSVSPANARDSKQWLGHSIQEDAEGTREILQSLGGTHWLVVDHYSLDRSWENQLRPLCHRIMVIDDSANRKHDCDVFLNQNIGVNASNFDQEVNNCRKLLGPKWALLRHEFASIRANLRRRTGQINRVLISFGGSDPTCETIKTIDAMKTIECASLRYDVVVGMLNPHHSEIEALCQTLPGARYHYQTEEIAYLMAQSDIAFGAAGTSALERLAVGLPTVVVAVADNQLAIMEELQSRGLALSLGSASSTTSEDYAGALESCLQEPKAVLRMSEMGLVTVDALGTRRVVAEMVSLS